MTTVIVAAAALFQWTAVVGALRVLRVTGRQPAWLLITAVAVLMAVRCSIVLYGVLAADPAHPRDALYEGLALLVSVLMAIGIARIGPFFIATRRAADQLRQSEERYRRLVEDSPVAVFVHDGLTFMYVNPAGAALLGATVPQQLIGRSLLDLAHPDYHGLIERRRRGIVETGATAKLVQQKWIRLDGAVIDVEVVSTPCVFGNRPAVQTLMHDITERRQAELEKATLQEQLHQAQKMEAVGQLSCGVAHDFNNLITVVLGEVGVARAALDAAHPAAAALATIAEVAGQARGVTDALLKFSGRVATEKRPLDLRAAVAESARLLGHTLPPNIALVTDTGGDPPVWVRADGTQLQQVILNLAFNARDALPQGGTLRLVVSLELPRGAVADRDSDAPPQAMACLTVADSGVGMSPEVRARIFDPFFTTKPRGQGTGLGLSVVHGIVEDHSGHIEVDSAVGAGATFRVFVPSVPAESVAGAAGTTRAPPRGQGELILVAERHQLVREIIVSTLRSLGYEVRAISAPEALGALVAQVRERVRLVISEGEIPAFAPPVPGIVLASGADAAAEQRLSADAVVLRKPFDMNTLANLVHNMLHANDVEESPA
jgi:PAS domain S-box-containing protein